MSRLLVHPHEPDAEGHVLGVTPESAGWRYVGFDVYRLEPGQRLARDTGQREVCLVLLTGKAHVTAGGTRYEDLGDRMSVFEGKGPYAVYLPAAASFEVEALTSLELAVCSAPGKDGRGTRLIRPEEMSRETRGRGTNTRHVRNILPDTEPADSLLVVEVVTPGGHWSSYPPHKHDVDNLPVETCLEETYYHRINPSQGFAFQRVYTDDRSLDETMTVQDGDVVLAPKGYHPVGAAHGYDLYYLNVMAGPVREWRFSNDPVHEWIAK
ncbi:MAG: 5-deoxy-glucuronate isomerase [Rhodospirillales bacterium]|nr:5-deoxy-glucuronate isomerase [Rhodospirillales bacterium]MDH3912199.1 5-deoxy-glucuronate isomerase [Rhodospirillales bacterium]MDH3919267.1 5-deoxy-glucuronate isomerase [Rhodospirillales bacterium]MDH3968462.1 5-deoxy-glucuronate isomerase [Rhodospirillales bacterium]